MIKLFLRYSIICLLLFGLTVCSDNIVESTPAIDENEDIIEPSPRFKFVQQDIFNVSCAFSGCHVSGSQSPNLSGNAYSIIVNKQSSTGMNYITPSDPGNSYLLKKVLGSSGINGSRMPLNGSALSQEKIDLLTQWIQAGALDN